MAKHSSHPETFCLSSLTRNQPSSFASSSHRDHSTKTQGQTGLYKDHPLPDPSKYIRTFTLHTDNTKFISGTLAVRRLEKLGTNRNGFLTLSYTWGNPDAPKGTRSKIMQITVNGYSLDIQENCWSALKHLRQRIQGKEIWIDAICINQRDKKEKAFQIPLMRNIYATARLGYIWLGVGDTKTDRAMDYLKEIGRHDEVALRYTLHLFMRLFSYRSCPHLDGLGRILSYSWISRIWTFQEVMLSKKCVIVCGNKSISWSTMAQAIEFIDYPRYQKLSLTFPTPFYDWKRLAGLRSDIPKKTYQTNDIERNTPRVRNSIQKSWRSFYITVGWIAVIYSASCISVIIIGLFSAGIIRIVISAVGIFCLLLPYTVVIIGVNLCFLGIESKKFRSIVPYTKDEAILVEFQTRQASKPKDKHDGILGLIGQTSLPQGPDRPSSLGAVYQAVFEGILKHKNTLDILLFSRNTFPEHSKRCPSKSENKQLGDCQSCTKLEHCPSCTRRRPCHACLSQKQCKSCLKDDNCSICNDIANCPSCTSMGNPPSWVVDWRTSTLSWTKSLYWTDHGFKQGFYGVKLKKYAGAAPTRGSIIDLPLYAFQSGGRLKLQQARVIAVLDWSSGRIGELSTTNPTDVAIIDSIKAFRAAVRDLSHDDMLRKKINDLARFAELCCEEMQPSKYRDMWTQAASPSRDLKMAAKLLRDGKVRKFHIWITNFLAREDMCLFRCLQSFGVAPSSARRGDKLVLILGVSTPMVLRDQQSEGTYEVVGPALFPGAMNLEYWKPTGNKSITLI